MAQPGRLSSGERLRKAQERLDALPAEKYPYDVVLGGRTYSCHEGVYGGMIDYASPELLAAIPVGRQMLEIGTGNGGFVASLYLSRAEEIDCVLATDINPKAVANAKANFSAYNIPAETCLSDMFQSIEEETFDAIFWHSPFLYTAPENELSALHRAVADPGYKCLEVYICDAGKFLREGGRVSLIFSKEAGNWKALQSILNKHRKRVRVLWTGELKTMTIELMEILP